MQNKSPQTNFSEKGSLLYQIKMNGLLLAAHIGLYTFFGTWLLDYGGDTFFVHAAISALTLVAYGYYIRMDRRGGVLPPRQLDRVAFVGIFGFNATFVALTYLLSLVAAPLVEAGSELIVALLFFAAAAVTWFPLDLYTRWIERQNDR